MNREQLIRICLDSGVVRRDVAIKLIETIEANELQRCVDVCNNLEIEGSMSYGSVCADAIQGKFYDRH